MSLRDIRGSYKPTFGPSHAEQAVSHQFEDIDQQNDSYVVGMWTFLVTEVMFFGALFLAYSVYRMLYPATYLDAHIFLDTKLGALNTAVLLLSSYAMAMSVWAAQRGKQALMRALLIVVIALSAVFLVVKYFEYSKKIGEGLLPGNGFNYSKALRMHAEEGRHGGGSHGEGATGGGEHSNGPDAGGHSTPTAGVVPEENDKPLGEGGQPTPAAVVPGSMPAAGSGEEHTPSTASADGDHKGSAGETGQTEAGHEAQSEYENMKNPPDYIQYSGSEVRSNRAQLFFSIYFTMTGLHGIHIIIGMLAMAILVGLSLNKNRNVQDYMPTEMVGLYWHFVDIVWIFLFPLMYLIS